MLIAIAAALEAFMKQIQALVMLWGTVILGIWILNGLNWATGSRLNRWGIYPRRLSGLLGLVLSPVLHQDISHLFFNTIPLFVLGITLCAKGIPLFYSVSLSIMLLSGVLVWLLGRSSVHIGASGLIFGYFGYLLADAYWAPSATTIVVALSVLYYFGGLLFGMLPTSEKVSWESHLFGFISGLWVAYWQYIN